MRERYRMYQRNGGSFYAKDRKTGQSFSLATSDKREAARLLVAKNQSTEQPCLNVAMAKVYLSAQSPEFLTRTWGDLIDLVARGYEGATAIRWKKFAIKAEDIDWGNSRLYYSRHKLAHRGGGRATLAMGDGLKAVLRELPASGPLFPRLRLLSEDERASHFRKVCLRARMSGVTLHSYRYSWAERACSAGMPEREAQAHLGHGSRAIHRAYARNAEVVTLPLDHYEKIKAAKLLPFTVPDYQDLPAPALAQASH